MYHSTQNRSFGDILPSQWHSTKETKPNTTKANNTGTNPQKNVQKANLSLKNLNTNQQPTLKTAHMCTCIITVHNGRTQYSTEQFL